MITAKNYASQAENGLKEFLVKANYLVELKTIDNYMVNSFIDGIKSSVHFCLPDNGKLLGDGARGLSGKYLRLPYKSITIEYYVDGSEHDDSNDDLTGHYPKRLVYATEVDANLIRTLDTNGLIRNIDDDKFIMVFAACANTDGVWVPGAMGMAVRQKWDNVRYAKKIEPLSRKTSLNGVDFCGLPVPLLPDLVDRLLHEYGSDTTIKGLCHDISMEVMAVIELCEALSCSNIEQSVFQHSANNIKRFKKGKLPIYETKYLTLKHDQRKSTKTGAVFDGYRNSPRQHLRRGHIRRLVDKNVWVNSCVVGDSGIGVIDKRYIVA